MARDGAEIARPTLNPMKGERCTQSQRRVLVVATKPRLAMRVGCRGLYLPCTGCFNEHGNEEGVEEERRRYQATIV